MRRQFSSVTVEAATLWIVVVGVLAILRCSASDVDPLDCVENDYLIGVTPATPTTRCKAQDKAALLAFKKGISSDPNGELSNWNSATDCCKWNGVTCDGKTSRVVSLNLAGKDLRGSISPGLSGLSKLQVLKLYTNYWTGSLPESLGDLSSLLQLCVSGSGLTGRIPESYGAGLSKLLNLDVGNNKLSGPLPSTIGGMKSLKKLMVYKNRISGAVPDSFGKLSNLYSANLAYNSLSGAVTAVATGNLTSLIFLFLDHNKITALPKNLKQLKNLQSLSLAYNPVKNADNLAGLTSAPKLSQVDLSHCQLAGAFPTWVIAGFPHTDPEKLSEYVTPGLDLSYNSLTGPIPANIGSALPDYLQFLYLNRNKFSGRIPPSLTTLVSLRFFDVSNNKLSGEIPQAAPLNSFDASVYQGNSGLCGSPLPACTN